MQLFNIHFNIKLSHLKLSPMASNCIEPILHQLTVNNKSLDGNNL